MIAIDERIAGDRARIAQLQPRRGIFAADRKEATESGAARAVRQARNVTSRAPDHSSEIPSIYVKYCERELGDPLRVAGGFTTDPMMRIVEKPVMRLKVVWGRTMNTRGGTGNDASVQKTSPSSIISRILGLEDRHAGRFCEWKSARRLFRMDEFLF